MTGTKTNTCVLPDFLKVIKPLGDQEKEKIIIQVVCEKLEVSAELVKSHWRKQELVYARFLIARFLKKYTKYPLSKIGQVLGGRDHTSIIHAHRTLQDWIDTEESTRQDVHAIDKILQFKL